MKKILGIIGVAVVSLLLLGAMAVPALAESNNTQLESSQTYKGFFIRAGETVRVDGTVDGDVWVAGNQVVVNGTVNGSVYAAGQSVQINGTVNGNVQAAGSKVEIKGKVTGAVYGAGSEVVIDQNAAVKNGAMLMGSLVEVNGPVGNQVILGGSIVKVNAPIDGNLTVRGTQAELGPNAQVNGNLKYNQDLKVSITNDKAITGSIIKVQDTNQGPSWTDRLRDVLIGLLMSLITGLALVLLLPRSVQAVADKMTKHPFQSFFAGLGFVIFVPVAAILLLISYFGIQLAALLGLGYVAVLLVGELFVALCIGNFITRPKKINFASLATSLILGLLLLTILKLIPFLGGIVAFVTFLMGAGAISVQGWDRFKGIRHNQVLTFKK